MESKLDKSVINKRAEAFSQRICESFFANKNIIKGSEILELTSIPQVNAFVYKILLQKWRDELSQIKSPYFDYSDNTVDEALKNLMNVLSHNISVSKVDFQPLLGQAIEDCVLIYFSPFDYFLGELGDLKNLKLEELKNQGKFYKVNNHMYLAIVEKLEILSNENALIDKSVQDILNDVFKEFSGTPDDFDWFLDEFNKTTQLSLDEIYFEQESRKDINSQFSEEKDSINDYHKDSSRTILADSLHDYSNKRFGELLSVNQRFMFTIELFKGDKDSFEKVIRVLDESPDEKSALQFLDSESITRKWNKESNEVTEFYELVSKRYKLPK